MKNLLMISTIASIFFTMTVNATVTPFSRKALITCDFSKFINDQGKIVKLNKGQSGQLSYLIDLDTESVEVNCGTRAKKSQCFLDGEHATQALTTSVSKKINFYSDALMPSLNIEGSNGDSDDMFARIGSISSTNAIAILTIADEGVDGLVSMPTSCLVQPMD